jgi:hypothetical protein
MSSTYTATFTITNAQYLASKIAADLKQMQTFYGRPTDMEIDAYQQEMVILLKDSYLSSMDYGFQKDGSWVLALSYSVNPLTGSIDQNPGRIPPGKDITGAQFYSYRRPSQKYWGLQDPERAKVESSNPVKREGADDPSTGLIGSADKSYSSGGQQVDRKIIQR